MSVIDTLENKQHYYVPIYVADNRRRPRTLCIFSYFHTTRITYYIRIHYEHNIPIYNNNVCSVGNVG